MSAIKQIQCEYCSTPNPAKRKSCLACGAPLKTAPIPPKPQPAPTTPLQASKIPEPDLKQIGESADKLYSSAINTYAVAWRTAGEIFAIAVASFIAGLAGGVTEMRVWGVLGALLIGLAIGLTNKNFYLVLIGAPGGAILGLFLGGVLWLLASPKVMVFCISLFAILGATLGGRSRPAYKYRNWWEKSRPYLGALGGLGFGVFGMFVGWGLQTTIAAIFSL